MDDDPCVEELGTTEELWRKCYAELGQAVSAKDLSLIRKAIRQGQLTGIVDEIARITGKRIERRKKGRPKLE